MGNKTSLNTTKTSIQNIQLLIAVFIVASKTLVGIHIAEIFRMNPLINMSHVNHILLNSSANTPIKAKQTPNRILVRTCDGLELRDPPYLPASPSPPRLTMTHGNMNSSRTSLFGGGMMGYGSAK